MSDDGPRAPAVDLPDGWVAVETTTERVFSVSKVTVTATTCVYEDERLQQQVEAATGGGFRRFVFTSRLRLRPSTTPSTALTKLVTSRAKAGFADRLGKRGMSDVTAGESRRLRVGDAEATLVRYDATCTVEGTRLSVDGWVAIWPGPDGDYLVAGGAYPTEVLDGDDLSDAIEPGRFRDELLAVVRSVR